MNKLPSVGHRNAFAKILYDEYYEKRGTTDKTKHKPSMPQPRLRHTRITTDVKYWTKLPDLIKSSHDIYAFSKQLKKYLSTSSK